MNEVSDAAERHAEQEVNAVLKGLLRNLTEVRNQQSTGVGGVRSNHQKGVVDGLNIAIVAVIRRIR